MQSRTWVWFVTNRQGLSVTVPLDLGDISFVYFLSSQIHCLSTLEPSMPMYEVEMRRAGGQSEFRLTDRALAVGDEVAIEGRTWRVEAMDLPARELKAPLRYICGEVGNGSRQLH